MEQQNTRKTKRMQDNFSKKYDKLVQQKQQLEEEMAALLTPRNKNLSHALKDLPPHTLAPEVIMGDLLFVLQEGALNPTQQAA